MQHIPPGINSRILSGKEILMVSYANLNDNEAIELAQDLEKRVLTDQRKELLLIVDITDTVTSPILFKKLKETSNIIDPYVKMRCVIGVEGVKKMLLTFYNNATKKGAKPVSSVEEGIKLLSSIL